MVRKQPCHMPCKAGKAHGVSTKDQVYTFKPVTIGVARAKIEELGLANLVEPWQHPGLEVCYAMDTHVLTHSPATLPTTLQCQVVVCQASYRRHTTHAPMHTRAAVKDRVDKMNDQLMAAAGDEVDTHTIRTVLFR